MPIHDQAAVAGRVVRDNSGRRLGTVAAVDYAMTGCSEAWYLIRLAWTRGQFRAVPAAAARWSTASRRGRREVLLGLERERVAASPAIARAGMARARLAAYYGVSSALAGQQ